MEYSSSFFFFLTSNKYLFISHLVNFTIRQSSEEPSLAGFYSGTLFPLTAPTALLATDHNDKSCGSIQRTLSEVIFYVALGRIGFKKQKPKIVAAKQGRSLYPAYIKV